MNHENNSHNTLYEHLKKFTLQCTLDQPNDITLYAIEHFTDIKNKRDQQEQAKIKQNELRYTPPSQLLKQVNTAEGEIIRHKKVRAEPYDIARIMSNGKEPIEPQKTDHLKRTLSRALRRSCLFKSMADDLLGEVIEAMAELEVDKGDCILQQGQENNTFYLIERGAVECLLHLPPVNELLLLGTLQNGDNLGELALLHPSVNEYSITALSMSTLWMIDRYRFRRITLRASCEHRDRRENLLQFVPILQNLTSEERLRLAETMQSQVYQQGAFVYRQGDSADGMFIVESGVAALVIRGAFNRYVEINRIGQHSFFGELALISRKSRPLSVIAKEMLCVEYLSTRRLEQVVGPCLDLIKRGGDPKSDEEIVKIFGSVTNVTELRDELIAIESDTSPAP